MERYHIFVSGKVQGVNFRNNTRRKAIEIDLKGFVQNLSDGRVEIIAEGKRENLEAFVEFCRQDPAFSQVNEIKYEKEESKDEFDSFSIRY